MGAAHAADPLDGRDTAARAARRGDAARHLRARDHGVDRGVAGIEDLADIRRSARSGAASAPGSARSTSATASPSDSGWRRRGRSRRTRTRPARSSSPGRRSPTRGVPTIPTTAGIPRPRRPLSTASLSSQAYSPCVGLDLIPVQVEAHDVDAELLEPVEPLVERAAAVDEPGVVLDPEADVRRGVGRGGAEAEQRARADGGEGKAHSGRVPGRYPFRHIRILLTAAAARFPRLHVRHGAHCREPDVEHEGERGADQLQDPPHPRSCVRSYRAG